jgi:Uma2 family endonuclease
LAKDAYPTPLTNTQNHSRRPIFRIRFASVTTRNAPLEEGQENETMATAPSMPVVWKNGYPTSDGKPMAETDWHRDLMLVLIETLKVWYAEQPRTYVSGNLLLFYEKGNRRKHKSPDVFVVKGVAKHDRPNYLLWQEGKGPDVVIELTSASTRREDEEEKYQFYQDVLRVKEYFLFDPLGDYLKPPMKGYRLRGGQYHPIRFVAGRLPSQVLGLHLERNGQELRLYDPATERWLPTPRERAEIAEERSQQEAEARRQAEERSQQEAEARRQAEERSQREAEARLLLEAETERLRREIAELRHRLPKTSPPSP